MSTHTFVTGAMSAPFVKRAADEAPKTSSLKAAVLECAGATAALQLTHWKASTKDNTHEALGDLYSAMSGLNDTFAECLMGIEGRDFPETSFSFTPSQEPAAAVSGLKAIAEKLLAGAKAANAEDLVNIAADMLGIINKTAYKLQQ